LARFRATELQWSVGAELILEKSFNHILKHKLIYVGVFSEALGMLTATLLGWGTSTYFIIGILLFIWFLYISASNKRQEYWELHLSRCYKLLNNNILNTLVQFFEKSENPDLHQEFFNKLIHDAVLRMLEEIGLKHDDPGIRVSLYNHSGNGFELLYRHSDDPEFQKKGRAVYADNEGLIGHAYHKNKAFVKDLPDPNISEKNWIKAQLDKSKGMMKNEETVKNLTMKSRNLLALPIRTFSEKKDDDDIATDKKTIIVFESLKPDQLKESIIEKAVNGQTGEILKNVLFAYRTYKPSLDIAEKYRM
jgi:hypothetical protein